LRALIAWAYGASFDLRTDEHLSEAGLELVEARYVANDPVKLLIARVTDGLRCGTAR
jgi:hypothetical protein